MAGLRPKEAIHIRYYATGKVFVKSLSMPSPPRFLIPPGLVASSARLVKSLTGLDGSSRRKTQSLRLPLLLSQIRFQKLAEGGGVEPRGFTLPWFSGPVANRLAAPSVAEEAGIEPAPVLPRLRVSNPVPYRSAILPVPKRGFEPPRSSLSDWHVCQLRHLGLAWSRWVDSNHHE